MAKKKSFDENIAMCQYVKFIELNILCLYIYLFILFLFRNINYLLNSNFINLYISIVYCLIMYCRRTNRF